MKLDNKLGLHHVDFHWPWIYFAPVIRTFRHDSSGGGATRGIGHINHERLARFLQRLDVSELPEHMNFPGAHFHALSGDMQGYYSVRLGSNWRLVFRWVDTDAVDVTIIDYH